MKTPQPSPPPISPRPGKTIPTLTSSGACTIQEAGEFFDIPPRKLAGVIARNRHDLGDPVGNVFENWVYLFSVERWMKEGA